jgi:hypothetical protein
MPKGFRKMAVYLGLVEDNQNYLDEEIEEFYEEEAPATPRWSPTPRAFSTNGSTALAERPEVRIDTTSKTSYGRTSFSYHHTSPKSV